MILSMMSLTCSWQYAGIMSSHGGGGAREGGGEGGGEGDGGGDGGEGGGSDGAGLSAGIARSRCTITSAL